MYYMPGTIDISKLKTPPEKHELATAKYFAALGKDVVFLPPSNIKEVYRPDILMDGVEWEIKAPQGKSRRTVEKLYRHASQQSKYIIFDLRRSNLSEDVCLQKLEREFKDRKTKRLLVIKKSGELIEFSA